MDGMTKTLWIAQESYQMKQMSWESGGDGSNCCGTPAGIWKNVEI